MKYQADKTIKLNMLFELLKRARGLHDPKHNIRFSITIEESQSKTTSISLFSLLSILPVRAILPRGPHGAHGPR